jgi:hypothetical protein
MINTRDVVMLMEELESIVQKVEDMPQMRSIAQEILQPLMNGAPLRGRRMKNNPFVAAPKRVISVAERKKRSLAMKKRWREARKAGKSSIGG